MSLRRDALLRVRDPRRRVRIVNKDANSNPPGERVPLFGSWRKAYLAVVAAFVVELAFFYFVSHYFS